MITTVFSGVAFIDDVSARWVWEQLWANHEIPVIDQGGAPVYVEWRSSEDIDGPGLEIDVETREGFRVWLDGENATQYAICEACNVGEEFDDERGVSAGQVWTMHMETECEAVPAVKG